MTAMSDPVRLTVPRGVLTELQSLTPEFTDRLHHLLERNTDNSLSPAELKELQYLVRISQFSQIVSMALALEPTQ